VKNERLANAVLYLLRGCPDAGLTKLLKLLYFTDFNHYKDHLASVTGAQYVALERGPVVDGYEEEFDALERQGVLASREKPVFGHTKPKKEYLPLVEPDMDAFSEAELATLDHVLLKYGGDSGLALSKMTHEEALPWSFVWDPEAPGCRIPYAMFRWLDNMADERDVAMAKERLQAKVAAT
jgi:uncharacterized phage-associated protein